MFRKPLSNERGALVYYISCTQGPCASNTRKNRICNILLPRRRSISCFNFFFQIISLPYVVAYDRCRLKKCDVEADVSQKLIVRVFFISLQNRLL